MNQADYQRIIAEVAVVISGAKPLMTRFEVIGFDETMSGAYLALRELYMRVVKEQRRYTREEVLAAEEQLIAI